ncbi:MAG: methionyl-tRNA formyltransferase [Ignavibacteriaceae bacterium]
MKIVFMGTPDFAIPSLKILLNSKHQILAVVTSPDKQRGRGQKVSYTPIKEFALKNNITFLQPEKLKDKNFIENLNQIGADLFVVVAFKILPKEVFSIPSKGSFNLHGSLLPKYRGAAPIQWALIKGEKETGVTTFKLEEKVDTGNIYLQKKIKINDDDNFGTLHDKLSELGAQTVFETVNKIEKGNYKLLQQNNSEATPAPKITKEICEIDWNKSAEEIHNLVRGLSPYPGAFFKYKDKILKIYKTEVVYSSNIKPFEFRQNKSELIIGCGENSLKILEIQQEGKRRMEIQEFLKGFNFK